MSESIKCRVCCGTETERLAVVQSKPDGETDFGVDNYSREIHRCCSCGGYINHHELITEDIYTGDYNKSIIETLEKRFARVTALPRKQSDNQLRVDRLIDFMSAQGLDLLDTRVLDVGSGTGGCFSVRSYSARRRLLVG